jgi:hypothetical protein
LTKTIADELSAARERPPQGKGSHHSRDDEDRRQDDERPSILRRRLEHHVRDDEEECEELHSGDDAQPASVSSHLETRRTVLGHHVSHPLALRLQEQDAGEERRDPPRKADRDPNVVEAPRSVPHHEDPRDKRRQRRGNEKPRHEPVLELSGLAELLRVAGPLGAQEQEVHREAGAEPDDHNQHVQEQEKFVGRHAELSNGSTRCPQRLRSIRFRP